MFFTAVRKQPLFLIPLAFSLIRRVVMSYSYDKGSFCVAFMTVPTKEVAKKIAHGLVEKNLAACVNIVPGVQSVYMWEGQVHDEPEIMLHIKTRSNYVNQIMGFAKEHHPYKVPELITIPIEKGNPDYLQWIGTTLPENTY